MDVFLSSLSQASIITVQPHNAVHAPSTWENMNQVFVDKSWRSKFCLLVGCVKNNLSNFSLTGALVLSKPSMLAFEQEHKKLNILNNIEKIDILQKLVVCKGRQEKLVKKIEKLWAYSDLSVLVMTQCNGGWQQFFCRPLCNCIAGYSENLSQKTC